MRSASLLFLLLPILSLTACGGGQPDCAVLTAVHTTVNGVVDAGTTERGARVEGLITVETTGVVDAPSDLLLEVASQCDEPSCAPSFECGSSSLSAGDTVQCAIVDDIEVEDCSYSCQLGLTVYALDGCEDAALVVQVVGRHEPPALGR